MPAVHLFRRLAPAVAACALAGFLPAASAQTSVGVSIGIYQPGVYGRIDIGNFPAPAVIYPQPIVVVPSPVAVVRRPIYLYVPPGHQKHWSKYCGRYGACDQPVYFVQEGWVREHYEHDQGHGHGNGNGNGKGNGKGNKKHGHD